jgi:type II secretory pathway component PulL
VITSEELRVEALAASAKRGKWVARRRILGRWLSWLVWSLVLPVIGLVAVVATLAGLAFWQYMGHDAAYAAAQKWVQHEFGSFKATASANNTTQTHHINSTAPSRADNTSMIPLTDEATPDLQIDRHLTIKNSP